MVNLLLWYSALGGIGLQVGCAVASSSRLDYSLRTPSQRSHRFSTQSHAPIFGLSSRPVSNNCFVKQNTNAVAAFATAQCRRSHPISIGKPQRYAPSHQQQRITHNSGTPNSLSQRPSTRLQMLAPEHYNHLPILATLTFFPWIDYTYDLVTLLGPLIFTFAAMNLVVAKTEEQLQDVEPTLALAYNGRGDADVNGTGNSDEINELLTPETYANARMAKRQVKDTISSHASEAFDKTDFEHEPHLSPELEDAEAAYEVALLANAAHELVEAAEKENRQSKAAMLEREKELEWIEHHDEEDDDENNDAPNVEAFQRALLAAQLANKSTGEARKQEAFQRSLLSARIANDVKVQESVITENLKEEFMGSEVRAASMGGRELMPFGVASAAASSAAAHALAEVEAGEHEVGEEGTVHEPSVPVIPAAAASVVADTAERMIMGEDLALFEHSLEVHEEEAKPVQEVKDDPPVQYQTKLSVQEEVLSEVDQWRKDYAHEVRDYIHQKAIEKTKERMFRKKNGVVDEVVAPEKSADDDTSTSPEKEIVDTVVPIDDADAAITDTVSTDTTTESKELVKKLNSEGDGVIKRALRLGIIRRMRQRRRFLVVALAVVVSRRLFLAYFGNALRLI